MFIETYYDDRAPVPPGSTSEPIISFPELAGDELTVWRNYLPMKREIRNLYSPFNAIPNLAIAEIKKATRCFDRVEIWSRAGDPMAVGVIEGKKPRYFSIARWGDAKLTLAQVKRRLWIDKWLLLLTATGGIGFFALTLAAIPYGG